MEIIPLVDDDHGRRGLNSHEATRGLNLTIHDQYSVHNVALVLICDFTLKRAYN